MAVKKSDHPDNWTREEQIEHIRSSIHFLTAVAVEGYKEEGRGMVFVNPQFLVSDEIHEDDDIEYRFIGESIINNEDCSISWPGDKEKIWGKEYDPEKEVLVCFVKSNGDTDSYRVRTLMTVDLNLGVNEGGS